MRPFPSSHIPFMLLNHYILFLFISRNLLLTNRSPDEKGNDNKRLLGWSSLQCISPVHDKSSHIPEPSERLPSSPFPLQHYSTIPLATCRSNHFPIESHPSRNIPSPILTSATPQRHTNSHTRPATTYHIQPHNAPYHLQSHIPNSYHSPFHPCHATLYHHDDNHIPINYIHAESHPITTLVTSPSLPSPLHPPIRYTVLTTTISLTTSPAISSGTKGDKVCFRYSGST